MNPVEFIREAYARGIEIEVERKRSGTFTTARMATDARRIGAAEIEVGQRELLRFLEQLPGDLSSQSIRSFSQGGKFWASVTITGVEAEFLTELRGAMSAEAERRRELEEIDRNFDIRVREEVEADPELIRLNQVAGELAERIKSKRKKAREEREGRREDYRYVAGTKEL